MFSKESEKIEFKKSTAELKEAVISLCAMLNKSNGGTVYFGIKNDGTIIGQQIGKTTTADIVNEIKNYIKPNVYPDIKVLEENGVSYISVEVHGTEKPYSAYRKYYIRVDDQDQVVDNNELRKLFLTNEFTNFNWEKLATKYGEEEVDEKLLISYIRKANELGKINFIFKSVKETLIKLELMENDKLNNAGYYLFSKNKPITIKFGKFLTDEKITLIDNIRFKGNIFECINKSIEYIINNINQVYVYKDLRRIPEPEIPIKAIREIVVNSFAHMRITNGDYNEISIFPSEVRIYNPGHFPLNTTPSNFAEGKLSSKLINPLIATTLYKNNLVENFGTGFQTVFSLCNSENIKYSYDISNFGFTFSFYRRKTDDEFLNVQNNIKNLNSESSTKSEPQTLLLTSLEEKILNYCDRNGKISSLTELVDEFDMAWITMQRTVSKLVKKNILKRVGSNKIGYWVHIEK
ncbi:RNA-binding domain-containing protein [Mycoplasma capricolum]|uniref:RNA-binding domain-containing protein n=1 Tax=Mycoplasma capricolum TaxID=2095 RepID=UPI00216415B4|nr:RNA-binding domain-containing protein [Mycoplasma capricolum]UVO24785.1 putative DNA binding domain-containing protein [Mycoplasma capricolum subsp. capripneumoniae]